MIDKSRQRLLASGGVQGLAEVPLAIPARISHPPWLELEKGALGEMRVHYGES